MISYVRAFLHRRAQRQAETKALRDAEHAAAIQREAERLADDAVRARFFPENYPSLPSQQLAREIEELRSGKVAPISRRRAAKDRQSLSTPVAPTIIDMRRPPTTKA